MKQELSSTNNQNLNEKIYQAMGWLSVLSLITCLNTLGCVILLHDSFLDPWESTMGNEAFLKASKKIKILACLKISPLWV